MKKTVIIWYYTDIAEDICNKCCDIQTANSDKQLKVTAEIYYPIRTWDQNSYLRWCVYKYIADYTWYDTEEIHEFCKMKFLRIDTMLQWKEKQVNIPKFLSTTELDTKQFTEYIDKIRNWASMDLWVYIPDANKDLNSN